MRDITAEQNIAKWEVAHGVKLPKDFSHFLTGIGNGGAGPYYGMYPLDKAASYTETEALASSCVLYPNMEKEEWNQLTEPLVSGRDISDEEYDAVHARILGGMLCIGTRGCEYVLGAARVPSRQDGLYIGLLPEFPLLLCV